MSIVALVIAPHIRVGEHNQHGGFNNDLNNISVVDSLNPSFETKKEDAVVLK